MTREECQKKAEEICGYTAPELLPWKVAEYLYAYYHKGARDAFTKTTPVPVAGTEGK